MTRLWEWEWIVSITPKLEESLLAVKRLLEQGPEYRDFYRWAGRMLVDAANVRRRERVAGGLAKSWPITASK